MLVPSKTSYESRHIGKRIVAFTDHPVPQLISIHAFPNLVADLFDPPISWRLIVNNYFRKHAAERNIPAERQ
jgi:hypothetical protein